MSERYEAVVIGAGHNGLVCAAYLARAGRRVLVLERSDRVGGILAPTARGREPDGDDDDGHQPGLP